VLEKLPRIEPSQSDLILVFIEKNGLSFSPPLSTTGKSIVCFETIGFILLNKFTDFSQLPSQPANARD
jgi:hypothetical protein